VADSFAVYVHIPFCSRKCPYCDFVAFGTPKPPELSYTERLRAELRHKLASDHFGGRPIHSIYFGGGTPSLFSPDSLSRVIEEVKAHCQLTADCEISIEVNPEHNHPEFFTGLFEASFNRVSFGSQSFQPRVLELLGRSHSPETIHRAIENVRSAGITNLSLDLIFGVPDQDLSELQSDIDCILRALPTHVSTYSLTIEKGTPFYFRQQQGNFSLPNDDNTAEMMELIHSKFTERNLLRYEVSNYAHIGFESRHNQTYWRGGDYVGIGAGATSFHSFKDENEVIVSGLRSGNTSSVAHYTTNHHDSISGWTDTLSSETLRFEFFLMGLRMPAGVSLALFKRRFGDSSVEHFLPKLSEFCADGLLTRDGDIIKPTDKGILLADSIASALL
jgi:oxygen-independent coproporphyrinogen III oxidase